MKKQRTILFFILFFYLFSASAQTGNTDTQNNDSILSDKGNLELLEERMYLAWKAFKTGVYGFNKEIVIDSAYLAHRDSMQKEGWHLGPPFKEKPLHSHVVKNGEKISIIEYHRLNNIPPDSVESVQVTDFGPWATIITLYDD